MERVIRRVTRSAAPIVEERPAQAKANAKQLAENRITDQLKLIAKLNREVVERAKQIEAAEAVIEKNMKDAKIQNFSDGVLEAAMVDTYSNEKKEVDPKTLFNKKGFTRDNFFAVVKVQIGELSKFMAENEVKAIATITEAKKTGTALKIKPVKTVVSTKPAATTRKKK